MQKVRGGYIGYKRYKYIIIGYHRREELHHHSGEKSKPFRLVFNSIFSVNIIIPSFHRVQPTGLMYWVCHVSQLRNRVVFF